MKLAIVADPENAALIRELLAIWDVVWVSPEDSDVVLVYGRTPSEISKRTILIPSDSIEFKTWTAHSQIPAIRKTGESFSIAATPTINLSFASDTLYEIGLSNCAVSESLAVPNFDFVEEFRRILRRTLTAKSCMTYRLATSFPLAYNIVPKGLRDYLMKKRDKSPKPDLCDVLPIDALRLALADVVEKLSERKLRRKTWNHKSSICVLTHDIDTEEGMKKSRKVKRMEEKYDLPSTWFIPTKQYALDIETIKELENNGEVGLHDTKHDGKLSRLTNRKLTERLREGKRNLESITNHPIEGFRAPLLQHSPEILHALEECGFRYDTSIPAWEPMHPRTMCPHGIGTLFPIRIEGTNEIPITLTQDHQLLYVSRLTPKETIAEWLSGVKTIKELGGMCVFLSHPEYGLLDAQGLPFYEELLNAIASDHELLVASVNNVLRHMCTN